jgi:phosphoserine aminotransferase
MPGAVSFAAAEYSSRVGELAHRSIVFMRIITRVAEQTVRILEVPGDVCPQYPTGMTTLVYPHAN